MEPGPRMYTRTTPWWLPLSIVLLAGGLLMIWYLFARAGDVRAADVNIYTPGPDGKPVLRAAIRHDDADVNSVHEVTTAPRREVLVGKTARLSGVPVFEVVGDRTFWVGTGSGDRLFCVLDRGLDDAPMEWQVVIREGQRLELQGDLRPAPATTDSPKWWNLSHTHGYNLADEKVYLHVTGIVQTEP